MKTAILTLLLLLSPQIPKNDPNGVWESESGSAYRLELNGSDLKVQIVEGSNPKFIKYEVNLKNVDDPNNYKGTGYFVAKMNTGKECKFEIEWQLLVVSTEQIFGKGTNVVADSNTCEIKEKGEVGLNLKKKK